MFIFTKQIIGQDAQFSQFYSAPLYLAPSFAGSTDGTRLAINFRDQWPDIPNTFITYAVSLDHYVPQLRSGIGVSFFKDVAGAGNMGYSKVAVYYTYNIKISKKFRLRPGIMFYRGKRSLDYHKLVFPDQSTINGISTGSSIQTYTFPDVQKVRYLDAGASLLCYGKDVWLGVNFDHFNTPDESLMGTVAELGVYFSTFGGIRYVFKYRDKRTAYQSISFAYNFKMHDNAKQLDLGFYWTKDKYTVGLWYRGIPVLKNEFSDALNHDALIVSLAYRYYNLKIGYSYDFTLSRLRNSTGGAHEISLIWEFNQVRKRKWKSSVVPCPQL